MPLSAIQKRLQSASINDRFVARQPILDRAQRTYAYELLFRNSWQNCFCGESESASQELVDDAVSFGMESLVGSARAFFNCTRQVLVNRIPTLLPRTAVLELLETIQVDDELVRACIELKSLGYSLALDDYDFSPSWEPLMPLVDYIKVDFITTSRASMASLMNRLRDYPIQFLAEKVETQQQFHEALEDGFSLFQGYFFQRPVVTARPSLSTVVNRFRFLAELGRPALDHKRLVELIKQEPSISYRTLRVANSAAIGTREPMTSIGAALAMIGEEKFRQVALLALATEFACGGAREFLRFILLRGRFCEILAPAIRVDGSELYLFGMLSAVGRTLNVPIHDLASTLFLRPEFVAGLDGAPNLYGNVLGLILACERGNWNDVAEASHRLSLSEAHVSTAAHAAHLWADEILTLA